MVWEHRWPIRDLSTGWLDLCAEAWADLHMALSDRGLAMTGRPVFELDGDAPRMFLVARCEVAQWRAAAS